MELFTLKIDNSDKKVGENLSLMRKKTLNRAGAATQEDCKEDYYTLLSIQDVFIDQTSIPQVFVGVREVVPNAADVGA